MKYRPEIDGLRAIAVTSVVLYHLDLGFPGGYLGVDIFFVISGYLITKIISSEMEHGDFTIAGFYERRVRRIFPALFAMLAALLVAGWFVLLPHDYSVAMRGAVATTLFGSNVVLWYGAGYFAPASSLDPLLHTWSLAVEEQFYLFFPLLLLLGHKVVPKHLRSACVIAAIGSIIAAAIVVRRAPDAVFYLTPYRAWELLAGSFLALGTLKAPAQKWLRELLGLAGIAAMIFSVLYFSASSEFPGNAVLAVFGAVALIYSSSAGDTLASRLLSFRPVRYIGAISYSWYLWHWPVIVLTRFRMDLHPGALATAGMFFGSLVLAMLSYHYVEQPFRRRKVGATRQRLFAMGATAMAATIAVGMAGQIAHGIPHRFDRQTLQLDASRRPVIPYRPCMESPKKTCVLGEASAKPTMVIWGDSHALSWAPAFDMILKHVGKSANFVVGKSCPPLLSVHDAHDPGCYRQNLAARALIEANPGLKTVVLVGRWHLYFGASHVSLYDDHSGSDNLAVASNGLTQTLRFLKDKGISTILVGDVPGGADDVPLSMALTMAHGSAAMRPITVDEVRARDRAFAAAAAAAERDGLAKYVDVVPWFCDGPACGFQSDGVPLYRDDNHLSITGSVSRVPQLTQALGDDLQGAGSGAIRDSGVSRE